MFDSIRISNFTSYFILTMFEMPSKCTNIHSHRETEREREKGSDLNIRKQHTAAGNRPEAINVKQ